MLRPLVILCLAALALAVGAFLFLAVPDEQRRPAAAEAASVGTPAPPPVADVPTSDDGLPRKATLEAIADRAPTDPGAAVQMAIRLDNDEERAAALHECLPQWLQADPTAARAWLLERGATFSHELLLAITHDVASADADLALTLVQRLPSGLRGTATAEIFETWAGSNPGGAAQRARFLANAPRDPKEVAGAETTDREVAVGEVSRLWAHRDPKATQAWALTLTDPALRRVALESLVTTWAEADTSAAAAGVRSLPASEPGRNRLIDRVMTHWAVVDAPAALDWVQTLSTPAEREAAATTLLTEVAQTQPSEAADWALHLSPQAGTAPVGKVLAAWAARDRATALAWASRLPPGPVRDACLRELDHPSKP